MIALVKLAFKSFSWGKWRVGWGKGEGGQEMRTNFRLVRHGYILFSISRGLA